MRHLHLLISGLCPDFGRETASVLAQTSTPALAKLLGRGSRQSLTQIGLSARLAALFNLVDAGQAPLAHWRAAAEGLAKPDGLLCADPVHLQLMLDHLRMAGHSPSLSTAEATALVASLNQHFAGEVSFVATTPQHWYARLARPVSVCSTPLDQARGRSVTGCLPGGTDGALLQRLLNEAQMLLHSHPINAAREARGLEPVNSVWFWGEGAGGRPTAPFDLVLADNPLAVALGSAAGIPVAPLPQHLHPAQLAGRRALVVHDALLGPALDGQVGAWQGELTRLESDWFKPLQSALQSGNFGRLEIDRLGDPAIQQIVTPLTSWRVWRRPGSVCA